MDSMRQQPIVMAPPEGAVVTQKNKISTIVRTVLFQLGAQTHSNGYANAPPRRAEFREHHSRAHHKAIYTYVHDK